jgi:hypothetical protein|tara:strand:+ start:892 stop:1128 length:237 start_codon:yes stop_codon:yes gene_type:complete
MFFNGTYELGYEGSSIHLYGKKGRWKIFFSMGRRQRIIAFTFENQSLTKRLTIITSLRFLVAANIYKYYKNNFLHLYN